jgi:hypothetical protein
MEAADDRFADLSLDEQEALWGAAKAAEREPAGGSS